MSGSAHEHAPLRLTRRGRAVVVCLAAAIILPLLWLTVGPGALAGGRDARPGPSGPGETVVVGPGETLWEIASASDPDADPRLVVQRIIDLNGLGGDPTVQPGQRLRLPAR
ncbi:LysM peptidoglycan-binding domain-containing protein [Actinomadura graeca]|uniref:LysM peptidoglycan-binding domain-containing protein n=1 Tax=Actinomadura graeca TaxID=2750812 RepID=A0ABX8QRK9_9ACTN|nr:LysM peptidoglycan-binding domain-containing protein [Actinomadura graeca]QXJ20854.1 LysM peptidoglycan-binding domain-containing protein [Actinomadura graeca]